MLNAGKDVIVASTEAITDMPELSRSARTPGNCNGGNTLGQNASQSRPICQWIIVVPVLFHILCWREEVQNFSPIFCRSIFANLLFFDGFYYNF